MLYETKPKPQKPKNKNNFIDAFENEILSFLERNKNIIDLITPIKQLILSTLKGFIGSYVNTFDILLYGSYAYNLQIESSDIDIRLLLNDHNMNITINTLINYFKTSLLFSNLEHIHKAKIPVVKIEINLIDFINVDNNQLSSNRIENEAISTISNFLNNNKEFNLLSEEKRKTLSKIKLDITYSPIEDNLTNNNIIRSIYFINQCSNSHKYLKGVFILLKFLFNKNKLNDSYKGGINSYCLIILIIAFIQHSFIQKKQFNTHSEIIINFLQFYSTFDFDQFMIDLTFPSIIKMRVNNYPTDAKMEVYELIANKNIASNCYNIANIQKILKLMEDEIKYKKKAIEENKVKPKDSTTNKKAKGKKDIKDKIEDIMDLISLGNNKNKENPEVNFFGNEDKSIIESLGTFELN